MDVRTGDKDALQKVYDKLTSVLESAALMLRGTARNHFTTDSQPEVEAGKEAIEMIEEPMWGARKSTVASENTRDQTLELDVTSETSAYGSVKEGKSVGKTSTDNGLEQTDTKRILFPSQIQKITILIALLSHKREILQRLMRIIHTQSGLCSLFS